MERPLLAPSPDHSPPDGYGSSPLLQAAAGPQAGGEPPLSGSPTPSPAPQQPDPGPLPIANMDQISGYDNVGVENGARGGGANIPPPPAGQQAAAQPQDSAPGPDLPTTSEEAAREALMQLVSSKCCYGKAAARELIFTNITSSSAFHYQLETFAEGRKTSWEYEPYSGQVIDGPLNGPAPQPWSIVAQPSQMFHSHEKFFEVPHTASVKICHNCSGNGAKQCWECHGRTRVWCNMCNGTGRQEHMHHREAGDHHHHHHHHTPCSFCDASGRRICSTCQGRGNIPCEVCLSRGKLKCYIKLTVSWKTHTDEEVIERTALPDELIRTAEGVVALQDQQPRVAPVTSFPDAAVNGASVSLVQKHGTAFPTERILLQRHWVRVVPVVEARCLWNTKSFNYFVYGRDNQVYAPNYPQKYCCGCCTLL